MLSLVLIAGCDLSTSPAPSRAAAEPAVAQLNSDGSAELLIDVETGHGLIRDAASEISPGLQIASFDSPPSVVRFAGGHRLVATGLQPDGNCFTVSLELPRAQGGLLGPLSSKDGGASSFGGDTCNGVGCTGCRLENDPENGNYCDCWRSAAPNGYCNHNTGGGPGGNT